MLNRLERADRAHSAMHPMVRWNMVYSKLYSLRAECHSLVLQERPQSVAFLSIGILAANIRISKGDLVVFYVAFAPPTGPFRCSTQLKRKSTRYPAISTVST